MPSWATIAAHLKEQLGKYVLACLVAVVGAIVLLTWHWVEANAGAALLDFASARLADRDPNNYSEDGKTHERNANYARAIRNFQQTAIKFGKMLVEADPDFLDAERTQPRDPGFSMAIREFQRAIIHKFSNIIATDDPRYIDPGKKVARSPQDVDAVKELLESLHSTMRRDITAVTRSFVGYVQTGTFELSTKTDTSDVKLGPGNVQDGSPRLSHQLQDNISKSEHSFGIFAGRNSHVYLELTLDSYDTHKFDIQLFFFNQSFCPPRKLAPGFNAIEFEITDLTRHGIRSLGGTCQTDQKDRPQTALVSNSEESMTERIANKGHQDQLIPVSFKIIPVGNSRITKEVSLHEAVHNTPPQQATVQSEEKVIIGYIAVVSPLVEDSLVK